MSSGSKYRKAIESVRQGLGKQRFLLAAASAAAAMWAPGAFAQVGTTTQIGIDLTTGRGEDNTLGATERAGAPGYQQTNWNSILTPAGGNQTALSKTFTSVNPTTGATSSLTLSMWWGTPNTWAQTTTPPTSADGRLMNGYIDSNGNQTGSSDLTNAQNQPYIAITGLTGEFLNGYKVVVYADGDSAGGRVGEYWLTTFNKGNLADVSGESDLTGRVFVKDTANFINSNTYTQVPVSSNTGAGAVAGNYVVFDGLNSPTFLLRADEFNSADGTPRSPINAIQIVAAPIQPSNDTEWAGPSGAWPNGGSWLGGVPNDSSYSANFLGRATGPTAVSLNSPVTVKKIRFDNTNSYTISGSGSINISPNSGLGSVTVASGSHSILVPVTASTTTTFDVAANSSLTLQNLTAGTNLVSKEGAGTMVLNSAGTFGAFAVNNGLLRLGGANVLGGGAVNGNTTGTIDLNGFFTNIKRLEGSPNITNSKSNTVDLNIRAETGALNIYGGVLSGPINVNLTGGGNVGFSGNNTYTGVTTISGFTMLRTQSATALGSTNAGTVLDNGWLSLWNNDIGFEPISITSTSSLIEFQDRGTIRGPITYGGGYVELDVDANSGAAGSAISLLGNVTGNIYITKLGNNGLVLGGHNTFPQLYVNQGWIGVAGDSDATTSPVGMGGLRLFNVGLRSIGGNHTISNDINIVSDSGTGMTIDPDPAGGTNVGVLTLTGTIDLQDHDTSSQQARRITTNADVNFAGKVTAGGIIKAGNGTLILSNATNDFNGGLSILAGKVSVSQTENLGGTTQGITFQGGMLQVTGTTMTNINARQGQINWSSFSGGFDIANAANTFTVSQNIGGPNDTGFFRKDGLGTLVITGTNQWSGGTTVNGGTLKIGSAASLPDNSAMTINGGLLDLNGNSKTFTSLNGTGGAIGSSATGGTLGVTVNGGGTWGGGIQNGPGTGTTSLTKTGSAALVLTGNSTYTGATTLSGGTLQVDGSLGNTAVSVASGTTLAGKGSIGGVVTVNSGGTIAPLPTQLTVGGLTLQSGSKLNFLLGDAGGSSLIQVLNSGGLTLNGGAISLAQGAGFIGNSYDLIRYNGAFTGNFSSLSLATPTIGDTTFSLVNNPGAISIVVGTSLYTWTGANNGNWDTATTNWKGAGSVFTGGGSARFDDTGATQAVNVTAPLTVGRLDVFNDTKDYTFSGSSIGGTGGLNKRGAAKATFTQPLTLTGPTVISSGVVQLDGAATLSSTSGINLGNSGPNPLDTSIPLAHGGTLYANGDNVNRLGTVPVSLNGGSLVIAKGATAGAGSATVGAITSNSGMSRVVVAPNGGNFALTSPSLVHAAASNGTVDFRAATGNLGDAAGGQIKFTTAPALSNGLIGGWATVGDNFASYDPANGVIGNVTSTSTALVDGAVNVRDTSGANMTGAGSLTVNSLVNSGDVIMPVGSTLTINSGAAMMSGPNKWWQTSGGGNTNIIRAGTGVSKMFFTVIDRGTDHRLKMVLADNGTPLTFVKNGEGFLALDAANTHTGGTVVNAGTLALYNGSALGTATSSATVNPGGTLDMRGQSLGTHEIIIAGSGDQGVGALINNGGDQQNAVINLTLAGDATIGGTNRFDVRGTGANIKGGTFTLSKVGTGYTAVVAPTSVAVGNINVSGGTLSFENGNNIMGSTSFAATVNAGGILQFWNNIGGETQNKPIVLNGGIVTSENAPTTLTGPIQLAGPSSGQLRANNALTVTNVVSGSGGFTKTGGNTLLMSANNTYTGPTIVNAGLLRVTGTVSNSAVTVNSTGSFELGAGKKVAGLTVNAGGLATVPTAATPLALTVGDGTSAASPFGVPASGTNVGKVQLNNNGLIVDVAAGGEAAAATSVRQALLAGFNGGAWNGNGLTSSTISGTNHLALGFGTPAEVPAAVTGGQFLGSAVDASAIVVKTTIAGDSNLDKTVNFADLLALAKNYNKTGVNWAQGDFTYDGTVNFADLLTLAKNYNQSMPTEPIPGASATFEADMAAAFAAVPEPGSLALLGIGAVAMLGRRQRRARKN